MCIRDRGEFSHQREVGAGAQLFAKIQGQLANGALLDSEQFSGGGLGTVRGYLESEAVGDNAVFGALELRSPPLGRGAWLTEWRVYLFGDAGMLKIYHALPQQDAHAHLASYGIGSRFRVRDELNGSLDAGLPTVTQGQTKANDLRFTFRLWADF